MKFHPLQDRVLIRRIDPKAKTSGDLLGVIQESAAKKAA